jgi:hypothetical protein
MVLTEDTGKMFEKAMCLSYGVNYDGKYKYGMSDPEKLSKRLKGVVELYPGYAHTAGKGSRYDFTNGSNHLSMKSVKKENGKVAPPVIGQAQPAKFCELLGESYTTTPLLKEFIQANTPKILVKLIEFTFDCPIVFFVQSKQTIRLIRMCGAIDWIKYEKTWTRSAEQWKNSSTLKIDGVPILEVQFHSKSRTNMAVRWYFENLLNKFRDFFEITEF